MYKKISYSKLTEKKQYFLLWGLSLILLLSASFCNKNENSEEEASIAEKNLDMFVPTARPLRGSQALRRSTYV